MISNGKFIMAVDDESDIVNLIKRRLEELNVFRVCAFTNAIAALEHFNSTCKDHSIIISDIRMPGMNGYEFINQVKKTYPQVKVILMSSFKISYSESLNALEHMNINAFIQKPFSLRKLSTIVQEQNNQL
jgi:DNA-binding NtrC family response regulator